MTDHSSHTLETSTESRNAHSSENNGVVVDRVWAEEETDLLNLLLAVAKHKRLIVGFTLLCTVGAVLYSLVLPNQYTAETKLLAPQSQASVASLLMPIQGLSGGGIKSLSAGALGLLDPNAMYIGVLQSRTIADRLIDRFDLEHVYRKKSRVDTRRALAQATNAASVKDGGITIQVTDVDRKRAADLANGYVEEFQRLTGQLALSEASQRRAFYEKELEKVRLQTTSAEAELRRTQERTGMLDADSQAKSLGQLAVQLKAQIAVKEVQVEGMSTFATSKNEDLILAQHELGALRAQLAQLKHRAGVGDDILVPAEEIPGAGLEYLRKARDVMYFEQMLKLLTTQFEAAQADEGRNAVVVQVLDPAEPPEKKSKPRRALIVIFVALLAGSISLCISLLIEAWRQFRHNSVRAAKLASLKAMLFGSHRPFTFFKPRA